MTFNVGDRVRITVDDLGPFNKGDEAVLIPANKDSSFPFRAEKLDDSADNCPVALDEIEAVVSEPTPAPTHTSPFQTCKHPMCNPNKEGTPVTDTKRRQVVSEDYEPGDSIFEVVAEDGDELWVKYVVSKYGEGDVTPRHYTIPADGYKDYVPQPVKGEKYRPRFGSDTVTVRGVLDGDVVVYDWNVNGGNDPYCRSVEGFYEGFQKVDGNG